MNESYAPKRFERPGFCHEELFKSPRDAAHWHEMLSLTWQTVQDSGKPCPFDLHLFAKNLAGQCNAYGGAPVFEAWAARNAPARLWALGLPYADPLLTERIFRMFGTTQT